MYGGREGPFHSANHSISDLLVSNLVISNLVISNLNISDLEIIFVVFCCIHVPRLLIFIQQSDLGTKLAYTFCSKHVC